MASGLADYYRGIRPRYGGALIASGSLEVKANDASALIAVAGKGMIYGGVVWLDYTLTQANSQVWLGIDGINVTDLSFVRLKEYNITNPRAWPVSLLKFDSINKIYSVGISYGITFETLLFLAYYEQHGNTPTVHYRLVYTLI